MAGVLAVIGREDCDAVLRRAASPLLRRSWQRLEILSAPGDRVALGFAGARGGVASDRETGVLVALDGELTATNGSEPGSPAERLLARYLQHGPRLDPPEGSFAAAVWDPRTRSLALLTDRLGSRPLYLVRRGRDVLAAGELKALVAAGLEPELDPEGWAQLLAFEQLLGETTPLAGVRLLPAASTLTISTEGAEHRHERWRYRLMPEEDGDESKLVAALARVLEAAVERRAGSRTALALSGGLDSRCLATVAGSGVTAATFGARGSEDFELGAAVAARTGLAHRAVELEPGYLARGAAATVWLAEGQIRCFHTHHLALRPLRSAETFETLLIGYAGDPVLRWGSVPLPAERSALAGAFHAQLELALPGSLAEGILVPRFAALLRGRARAALARVLEDEDGDPVSRRNQLCLRQIYRRKVLPGAELFSDDLAPRDPYTDHELIEFCRRLPLRFRTDGYLQRAYLRRFPALAGVRSPKDGLPPGLSGGRRRLAAQKVRAKRRARGLAAARLGARWWPRHGGLGDYSTDLRRASAGLLGMLLEPRTLARGQLRGEAVERLISETLRGRGRNAKALGMLLTLELFQRQFLDGEEPPPSVADPSEGPGVLLPTA